MKIRRRRSVTRLLIVLLAAAAIAPAAGAAGDIDTEDENTDRVPLHTIIPDYPEEARRDRIEGNVQVCFKISRAGMPWRIAVRKSTNRVFEKPAIKAVRASTFTPLGPTEPVPKIKACRTFRFYLEPVPEDERE